MKSPTVATCDLTGGSQGDQVQWTIADGWSRTAFRMTRTESSSGSATIGLGPTERLTGTTALTPRNPSDRMNVCVRAKLSETRFGPWVFSSAYTIQPQAATRN